MDMKMVVCNVLEMDAGNLVEEGGRFEGKSAGRAFAEALAAAAIHGDIKAAGLLMELAGEDIKSREYAFKHGAESEKAPVIVDVRPEEQ